MEWMERIARKRWHPQEFVYNEVAFSFHWSRDEDNPESEPAFLWTPKHLDSWKNNDLGLGLLDIHFCSQAQKVAWLLKKSVVDESLPVDNEYRGRWPPGGRKWDAYLLGEIKCYAAIPELVEAARHDLNSEMRGSCVEALARMGKRAGNAAFDISQILLHDENDHVRLLAARALKELKNPVAVRALREVAGEARDKTQIYERMGYFGSNDDKKKFLIYDVSLLLQEALVSLFKLDNVQGREEIAESLRSDSPLVHHHAKNAYFSSGLEEENRRIIKPSDCPEIFLGKLKI